MTAWMIDAINPNLIQTVEGQPVFVHAGPFANIAIGQSSIIADKLATRLVDYHITESGFAADIGFEKFWNLKCRMSGLTPNAVVIVATIRALKMHGGGPAVKPGVPLNEAYIKENVGLLRKAARILSPILKRSKNRAYGRWCASTASIPIQKQKSPSCERIAEQHGALVALSEHWLKGGEGARELSEAVIQACNEKNNFKFLYELNTPLRQRIELIAKEVYGASRRRIYRRGSGKGKGLRGRPGSDRSSAPAWSRRTCLFRTILISKAVRETGGCRSRIL